MSATISSPPAGGDPVSGNPLVVVVHYNTTVAYDGRPDPPDAKVEILGVITWKLDCTVNGNLPTTGSWSQSVMVPATDANGNDHTFNFYDTGNTPIPDGTYSIRSALTKLVSLPASQTPYGSDTHDPVTVQN